MSFVYAIRQVSEGAHFTDSCPVKIGVSDNPISRLSALQSGCPDALEIWEACELPTRKEAFWLEGQLHRSLDDLRIHGEWFQIPPIDMAVTVWHILEEAIGHEEADRICRTQ